MDDALSQSATTNRAGGMRKAPRRGLALLVVAEKCEPLKAVVLIGHTSFFFDISVSRQHGICIPNGCGLNLIHRS